MIPQSVLNTIGKYDMLPRGGRIVLGVSGGADSVSLVHMLSALRREYGLELTAVHVNHGIRGPEADADEAFVAGLCRRLGVELDVYSFDVPAEAAKLGLTLEEAGRALRYRSFGESLEARNADRIAVAHNLNDNVETVLMRIFRGTGMRGLCGIPAVRGNIIRPLIDTTRGEIEEYCVGNGIEWRTDSTNLANIYTRNVIRLDLLPMVEEKLAQAAMGNITRMTRIIAEEDGFLDGMAAQALAECRTGAAAISVTRLAAYPDVLKRRIMRQFFLPHTADNHDISYLHVNMALGLLTRPTGKSVDLPFGLTLARSYDELIITSHKPRGFCYDLPPETEVFIAECGMTVCATLKKPAYNFDNRCTKTFSCDKMRGKLQVRSRRPGDRIYVSGMGGHKKLKDYFIDVKTPRDERDTVPLITCGDDVLWIMDDRNIISDVYKADEGELIYIWKKQEALI